MRSILDPFGASPHPRSGNRQGGEMSPEQQTWMMALAILDSFREEAEAHVRDWMVDLAIANDRAGVRRWRAVGERIKQLRQAGVKH